MEVSGQLHVPRERHWYPLDRRLDGPQSWCGYGGKDIPSLPLVGIEPQSSP